MASMLGQAKTTKRLGDEYMIVVITTNPLAKGGH